MSDTKKKQSKRVKPTSKFMKVIREQKFIEEKSITLCAEEPKVRYLKLRQFYRPSQTSCDFKKVPELRLMGNWLEKAGFLAENYVSVTIMDRLLVIRSTTAVGMDDYKK